MRKGKGKQGQKARAASSGLGLGARDPDLPSRGVCFSFEPGTGVGPRPWVFHAPTPGAPYSSATSVPSPLSRRGSGSRRGAREGKQRKAESPRQPLPGRRRTATLVRQELASTGAGGIGQLSAAGGGAARRRKCIAAHVTRLPPAPPAAPARPLADVEGLRRRRRRRPASKARGLRAPVSAHLARGRASGCVTLSRCSRDARGEGPSTPPPWVCGECGCVRVAPRRWPWRPRCVCAGWVPVQSGSVWSLLSASVGVFPLSGVLLL